MLFPPAQIEVYSHIVYSLYTLQFSSRNSSSQEVEENFKERAIWDYYFYLNLYLPDLNQAHYLKYL